jgi:hypothetical protein
MVCPILSGLLGSPAVTTTVTGAAKNQTAFWGKQPNKHQKINGEQSSTTDG